MPSHIALRGLPIENLKRKPFRTGALLAVVTILALTFFGGTMLTMNLNTGMTSMEKRLGADLMVVPQNTVQKAEALLTNGNPSTFYFTKDIADEVMQADGIAQATEQTYISSLAAACCAEKLQIIGYDPDTDFVIEPWVASQFEGPLEDGQMIAGANVNVSTDGTIELYGRSWPVVAQLANTGTSLDNSVFISQNTVPDMVAASAKVSKQVMSAEYAGKAVSTVMIKTQQGYEAQTVAENIKRLDSRFADLGYVYPGGITANTRTSLTALVTYLKIFVAVIWVMGVIVLLAVFASSVNERKREFASLRIMGATRGMLNAIILKESAIIGLIGGVIGVGAASLVIFPFSSLIGKQLQLPYLQASPVAVIGFIAVTIVCSTVIGIIGSLATMWRLGRPEAYLTTTPLQPTTVEPTKLQPTTPAQPNAPTAPDSPHVTETPSPDHLLTLTDLTRQFVRRGTPFDAVSHVNLTVDAGEFIAIVGRSGNGKSTLINMVAGLIRPTSGTVSVAGRNVADLGDKALSVLRNRTIGFVTQSQTLLGNLTVLDNVILPATMFPEPLPFAQNAEATDAVAQAAATNDEAAADSAADPFMPDVIAPITDQENTPSNTAASRSDLFATRARTLLTQLGVADLADSYPRELSGGEMRRVSIARALMNQPSLLIADEPTGDLDQESTDIVMRLLRDQANNGTAILMVTHDPDALEYADRVYRMDAGVLSIASV